jgi:endonuclease/exonuclease/phosphatase family metal-dependent hydrolase
MRELNLKKITGACIMTLSMFGLYAQTTPIPFQRGAYFPKDYAWNKDTLTLVSWNVEHFTDTFDNPYINHRMEDSTRVSDEKMQLFVEALLKFDADVVLLQEFESAAFGNALAKQALESLGYKFVTAWESKDWYMNVVMLSRVPIGVVEGYGNVHTSAFYPNDSGDTIYEVQSLLNDRMWNTALWPNAHHQIFITGVHLKAGRRPRDKAMRLGQLDFLMGRFFELTNGDTTATLLLAGDLNSYPDSEEIAFITSDKQPVVLSDPLSPNEFSHPADAPRQRLDYILMNPVGISRSAKEAPVRILKPYGPAEMRKISDHLPLQLKIFVGQITE